MMLPGGSRSEIDIRAQTCLAHVYVPLMMKGVEPTLRVRASPEQWSGDKYPGVKEEREEGGGEQPLLP
ncbi:hypothetical protein VTO42DRAFT_4937 [Malbranchea cinnamomea]